RSSPDSMSSSLSLSTSGSFDGFFIDVLFFFCRGTKTYQANRWARTEGKHRKMDHSGERCQSPITVFFVYQSQGDFDPWHRPEFLRVLQRNPVFRLVNLVFAGVQLESHDRMKRGSSWTRVQLERYTLGMVSVAPAFRLGMLSDPYLAFGQRV